MTTKKPKISIYISEEQKGELDEWAKEEKRSVSNLISLLVDEALASRREKKGSRKQ